MACSFVSVCMRWWCLLAFFACIALVLQGCGPLAQGDSVGQTDGKRVVVMRHCVRSTGPDSDEYVNQATGITAKASDLTNKPFPSILADDGKLCTEGGKKIIEATGKFIKEDFQPDASGLNIVVDADATRDETTAYFLAKGMGLDISSAGIGQWDASVFLTVKDGACTHEADIGQWDEKWGTEYHTLNYENTDMPMGIGKPSSSEFPTKWNNMLAELEKIIGSDGTYKITDALAMDPNNLPSPQDIIKACAILKFFAQQFLYSYASGVTWGIDDPVEIKRWAQWIYYARHVKYPQEELLTRGLTITNSLLTDLDTDTMPTTIYVGHDTQLDEMEEFFGLDWELPGYGKYATPPGSGFVFTREPGDSRVRIQYMYPDFDGSPDETEAVKIVDLPDQTWEDMKSKYDQKSSDSKYPQVLTCKQALDDAIAKDKDKFDPSR